MVSALSAVLCFQAGPLRSSGTGLCLRTVALHGAISLFTQLAFLQRCLVVTWLVPRQTAAISAHVLCTPYSHAPRCSVIRSHIHRVWAEWQGSFTCYCGKTGVERVLNKSQHRKMSLEKKILPRVARTHPPPPHPPSHRERERERRERGREREGERERTKQNKNNNNKNKHKQTNKQKTQRTTTQQQQQQNQESSNNSKQQKQQQSKQQQTNNKNENKKLITKNQLRHKRKQTLLWFYVEFKNLVSYSRTRATHGNRGFNSPVLLAPPVLHAPPVLLAPPLWCRTQEGRARIAHGTRWKRPLVPANRHGRKQIMNWK